MHAKLHAVDAPTDLNSANAAGYSESSATDNAASRD
jgi:phage terminase small subunit